MEPSEDGLSTPKHSRLSQPSTPKSVSFADKSITLAARLRPMATPQAVRFVGQGQSDSASKPRSSLRLQVSPRSSGSPRSVRDRSPTPERYVVLYRIEHSICSCFRWKFIMFHSCDMWSEWFKMAFSSFSQLINSWQRMLKCYLSYMERLLCLC